MIVNTGRRQVFKVIASDKGFQCSIRTQQTAATQADAAVDERVKSFSEIPQPARLPLLGTALDYTKHRGFDTKFFHEFIRKRHQELGPIYKESVIPGISATTVFCSSPEDNQKVFRHEGKTPIRTGVEFIGKAKEKVGIAPGVGMLQGDKWLRMRRIVNEFLLSKASVWSYTSDHMDVAYDLVEYIERHKNANNEVPGFEKVLKKWALEGACVFALDSKCGFLRDKIDENARAILDSTNGLVEIWSDIVVSPPLWKYFRTKQMKNLYALQGQQVEAVKGHRSKVLKEKQEENEASKLDALFAKSDLSTREEVGLLTESIGGVIDGTPKAAAFFLYCLSTNPEKQETLRKEILNLLSSNKEITGKTLMQMRYMHAVNKEVQRMYPLVSATPRKLPEDVILSGYHVPADTAVLVTSNIMNARATKYYDDPDSFIPERWLNGKKNDKFVTSGSFGHGPRMCPGRMFALQQIFTMTVAILSRYRVEYHHRPFEISSRIINAPSQEPQFSFVSLD